MVEKRKRASTANERNNGSINSVSRTKLDNELRWNWIGSEVAHPKDITVAHRIRVAGLELYDGRRPCRNKYAKKLANGPSVTGATDANGDLITIDSEDELDIFCSKRMCKDSPFCLNYLGQDLWEDEG